MPGPSATAPRTCFPPGQTACRYCFLFGILGIAAGIVFLVSAVHPRPNQKRAAAEKAAREDAALNQAEAYYSESARAADRDWRSAPITPPPAAPVPQLMQAAAPVVPPPAPATTPPPPPPTNPFPASVTLAPVPKTPAGFPTDGPHPEIRAAIAAGKLAEAEQMLNAARETATGLDLAHLTALAGDHAAAAGQQSHAKWLWRLAMKRFGENGALESADAQRIAAAVGPQR